MVELQRTTHGQDVRRAALLTSPQRSALPRKTALATVRVAIWMLNAFSGLVRCLEAVAMLAEQFGHGLVASLNASCEQLRRQRMRALARPPQRRLRITTGDWIDQLLGVDHPRIKRPSHSRRSRHRSAPVATRMVRVC